MRSRGERAWRSLERRKVVVHLITGGSIEGVLWETNGPLLVLRDAYWLDKDSREARKIDGEPVIERPRVEFIQMLPPGPAP